MTSVGPVHDFVMPREESWNRYSSFWGMFPFRRPNIYLGCKQRIRSAVNDRIGIEPVVKMAAI